MPICDKTVAEKSESHRVTAGASLELFSKRKDGFRCTKCFDACSRNCEVLLARAGYDRAHYTANRTSVKCDIATRSRAINAICRKSGVPASHPQADEYTIGSRRCGGDDRSPPGSYGSPPDVIIIYGLGGLCLIFVLLLAIYGANYIIQSKQEVRLLESEANDSWILRVPEGASSEDVPIPVVIATSRPARISPRSSLTAFPSLETFLRQDYMTRQNDGGVSRGTGDERVHSTRALETAL